MILLDCGHVCACADCAAELLRMNQGCPVCRFPPVLYIHLVNNTGTPISNIYFQITHWKSGSCLHLLVNMPMWCFEVPLEWDPETYLNLLKVCAMHTSCLNSKCVEKKLEIATITDVRGGGGKGIQGRASECLSLHRLVVVLGLQLKVGNLFLSQTETQDGQQLQPWAEKGASRSGLQLILCWFSGNSAWWKLNGSVTLIDKEVPGSFPPVYIITFFLGLLWCIVSWNGDAAHIHRKSHRSQAKLMCWSWHLGFSLS